MAGRLQDQDEDWQSGWMLQLQAEDYQMWPDGYNV